MELLKVGLDLGKLWGALGCNVVLKEQHLTWEPSVRATVLSTSVILYNVTW